MAETHRYSVSVAAAVVREDGKVLAIKRRDNGHWEPPGGVLEPGEPVPDGLRREVLEETGLEVEPVHLTGIYQNLPRDILALVFRCPAPDGEPRVTDESAQTSWLTPEEVAVLMTEVYAVRVLDALAYNGSAHVRQHDGHSLH